jgi:hypothetical protein
MSKPSTIAVAFALTLTVCTPGLSQGITEKFDQYRSNAAQEKIYVHTDREVYITGETLQLSAYVVDGSLHKPGDLSRVAYVELLDAGNVPVVQAKINLTDGRGGGSLFLPASLSSGNFLLRAYTRWMKNFDSDFFFHKKITIVNTFVKLDRGITRNTSLDIQFFPEGGNWISGVEGKVGFKVADANGRGVEFSGSLIDERNDTLLRFHPYKFGMGSFNFTPQAGKPVRAVIKGAGQQHIIDLAGPAQEGYALKLTADGTRIRVDTRVSASLAGATVYLFAHSRQVIVKGIEKALSGNTASFELSIDELPEGITHFTLFNSSQQPVCERLFFKAPAKKLEISATTNEQQYGTRREVRLDLRASQNSSASVSVYRLDSVSHFSNGRILEYLWLASDLKGTIESPEFYFTDSEEARVAGDNLMLSQGWRKFRWNEVLTGKPAIKFLPEPHGHIIDGLLRNSAGDTAVNVLTYLTPTDKIISTYTSRSDKKGRVIYEVINMYGPRKIVVYAEKPSRLEITNPFSAAAPSYALPALDLPVGTARDLLQRSVAMQVGDIYHEESLLPVHFDSLSFYGKADETYFLDAYTRFPVMEEVLREYVAGVMVRKNKGGFHFQLPSVVARRLLEDPMVLLDGVPIMDVDKIMEFDPLRVNKLEVVKRTFYNGLGTFDGIVSFSTYDGDLGGFPLDEHYVTIDYDGLNLQREFYRPNYDKQSYENLPDPRSLLFWSSSISLKKDEPAHLGFFTSDVTGRFVVVVDGLAGDGKAGSATYEFSVKP